jgi:hypothetical protein
MLMVTMRRFEIDFSNDSVFLYSVHEPNRIRIDFKRAENLQVALSF